ncbi:hypothetical protein HRG_006936 [Hirsutella rhossiliensis]|uniref:Uncharacterized protein n=1 Tax=Hirsutella rhossiliensis TaxID=111463 RepID=A0A9P8MX38_9HYPO|nr:uncharacterized protein HRG_06936 [Hirsutella rhossiliensis]KAH0961856.1 hypothetical protein HRG_06936 [Hirsutella rhossiliensis]
MRRAVLTSSEVSVLASMIIVILCTLALFLSGYAIQQRTLRDLRAAIRPRESRPSPKAHLPDRFRTSTTELADGSVVLVESEAAREAREMEQAVAAVVVVTQQTSLEDDAVAAGHDEQQQQQQQKRETDDKQAVATEKQRAVVQQLQAQVAAKSWGVEHPDPLKNSRIPVTRAERRRMIKDEIRRLAQAGDQPVYYQRRLW